MLPRSRAQPAGKASEMYFFLTTYLQDGAPKIAKLPYFSGFMVDITIVNRGHNGL